MVRCPSCGEENPDRAKFCLECATPLSGQSPAVEERKVVTVLFCDLVGFTARSDGMDPEDVRAALAPYHERLRAELERYGGTVEKFIGDAVMAVFGAPVAHEDDAERAVRAGLRVLAAIEDLGAHRGGEPLAVRVGIATGEAVVALGARPEHGEGIVAGDVVNTAARLQTAAPVGGVLVGAATHRLTESVIDYTAVPAVRVKGKAEPLPVWRAVGARSRSGAQVPAAPFVGRVDELEVLRGAFRRTVREASLQLVTIIGAPGVGKSRLLAELFRWLDESDQVAYWREGRCLPYGDGITFWAVGEVVKAHAGILESDDVTAVRRKLADAVGALAELEDPAWVTARLGALLALPDAVPADRAESFAAWLRFLEAIAASHPLVLVVEDAHWSDAAVLEFLEYVVDYASAVPILLVVTARPELYDRAPGWGGGRRNVTTLGLTPLTDAETAQLLAGLLQAAALPAEMQQLLLAKAGGNPLFAQEYLRMLTDQGQLVRDGRATRLASDSVVGFPDTVQAVIAARLDTLPSTHKRVLQDAAVIGKVFWSGAVAALDEADEGTARDVLHELTRRDLVRGARTSSVVGQAEYSFAHVLIRDVAYAQIPRQGRVARHERAARWIENLAGDRLAESAELLAHHYGTARDAAAAMGDADATDRLTTDAVRCLTLAGDTNVGMDPASALRHYRQALALLPADAPGRADLLLLAARRAGDVDVAEAATLTEEAVALFRAERDDAGVGAALAHLALVRAYEGNNAAARALLAEALPGLERAGPSADLANAYLYLGWQAMSGGDAEESLSIIDRALDSGSASPETGEALLWCRGLARARLGDLAAALDDLQLALSSAATAQRSANVATGRANLAELVWLLEGCAPALSMYAEAVRNAHEHGLAGLAISLESDGLRPRFDAGEWAGILRVSAPDPTGTREALAGGGYLHASEAPMRAMILSLHGELTDSGAVADALVAQGQAADDLAVLVRSLAAAALLRHRDHDPAGAIAALAELARLDRDRTGWFRSVYLPDTVRISLAVGRRDIAERLVAAVTTPSRRGRLGRQTADAVLAEDDGHLEHAATAYDAAALAWRDYRSVLEEALALLGAGRCLHALGRRSADRLHRARDLLTGLGARQLLAEADELLAAIAALSA